MCDKSNNNGCNNSELKNALNTNECNIKKGVNDNNNMMCNNSELRNELNTNECGTCVNNEVLRENEILTKEEVRSRVQELFEKYNNGGVNSGSKLDSQDSHYSNLFDSENEKNGLYEKEALFNEYNNELNKLFGEYELSNMLNDVCHEEINFDNPLQYG